MDQKQSDALRKTSLGGSILAAITASLCCIGPLVTKADVRVRVGLKESEDPVQICYCFGFTEAMARKEIEATGKCTIQDRISVEMKKDLCACEIRNPQGSCCLGNVAAAIKRLVGARAKATPAPS